MQCICSVRASRHAGRIDSPEEAKKKLVVKEKFQSASRAQHPDPELQDGKLDRIELLVKRSPKSTLKNF